jgi:trigger factor
LKVDYIEETSVRKALVFEVDPEIVQSEIDRGARELSKKARLPGFRPGKVPADVAKRRFREDILSGTAETIVNKYVFKELDDRGLKPLGSPRVEDLRIAEGEPMSFRAVFETLPLIEVPDWKGLRVTVQGADVTDDDVDKEIDRLREEAARYEPVEPRPTQTGDHVVVDLTWTPRDGSPGGHDENAMIEIGHEGNHEDMNAALQGMSVDETTQVDVTWGHDAAPAIAGKTVGYEMTVKAIKKKVVPEADDEFAKDLGEFDDLDALKAKIREQREAAEARRVERDTRAALVEALVGKVSFEVPETLVEHHMTARTENLARGLAYQGLDPRKVDIDWREYRESQRENSVKATRADILLDEIATREDIQVLDAEVDAEIARLAEGAGKSPEALRAQMEKEGDLASVRGRIREEKTLDLLKANASIELT